MADMATLSALLQVLFDKMSTYLVEEHGMLWLLGRDVERLPLTLSKVQAIFSCTQKHEIKDQHLVTLLNKLRDAAYEAEDVLDEFEYRVMRAKSKQRDIGTNCIFSSVCYGYCCCLSLDDTSEVKEIQSRCMWKGFWRFIFKCYDDRSKLRDSVRTLDCIASSASGILKMVELDDGVAKRLEMMKGRETCSLLTKQIFGREEVTRKLLRNLIQDSENGVGFHAITGIGGVGKTTLAQFVYNHETVVELFKVRMWISVTCDLDVKMVIREMLEYFLHSSVSDLNNLDVLQSKLREKLQGERCLFVFDGVLNMERSKWKGLRHILESVAGNGSKILITTRNKHVADIMGAADPVILDGLSMEEYWPLFVKCAFGDEKAEISQEIKEIGLNIAAKLDGSPLAAITLGRLLSCNIDCHHWRSVSERELWELKQDEDDILPVLRLSYQHLPSHLKPCFVYCSLIPKGHNFHKKWLIQLWIAQGFILKENEGDCYFDEFLSRYFFRHIGGNYYSMNELIYYLASYVSKDIECRIIERSYRPDEVPQTTLHLSFSRVALQMNDIKDLGRLKKLRTLIFFGCYDNPDFDHVLFDLFTELKSIRVLGLSGSSMMKLPVNIDNLRHLRHLDLSFSINIKRLPGSTKHLYNLQFLNVQGCNIYNIPNCINNLVNLQLHDRLGDELPIIENSVPNHDMEVFANEDNDQQEVHQNAGTEVSASSSVMPYPDIRPFFTFGNELKHSAYSAHYLCTENSTGLSYLCKSLSKRQIEREDIEREIQILQHLTGQGNIVEFKGAYEDKHSVHLITELCSGGDLLDRIVAAGHYTEKIAAGIFRSIVNVVNVCHFMGVMHRDIKPENFLFATEDGAAALKTTEFGLSVFIEEGKLYSDVVGTPDYIAPEVLNYSYGKEIDVWSAGVVLYILLSGVPPFFAETTEAIFEAILKGDIDYESSPWPSISNGAKDLIKKMLTKDPKERITAAQVPEHPWIKKGGESDKPLDSAILLRMKQFRARYKLKKLARKV